jgi:hypothetical protein
MASSHVAIAGTVSADDAIVATLQPNPLLGFLMQAAALGAFLGTLVGYWRRRTNHEFDLPESRSVEPSSAPSSGPTSSGAPPKRDGRET